MWRVPVNLTRQLFRGLSPSQHVRQTRGRQKMVPNRHYTNFDGPWYTSIFDKNRQCPLKIVETWNGYGLCVVITTQFLRTMVSSVSAWWRVLWFFDASEQTIVMTPIGLEEGGSKGIPIRNNNIRGCIHDCTWQISEVYKSQQKMKRTCHHIDHVSMIHGRRNLASALRSQRFENTYSSTVNISRNKCDPQMLRQSNFLQL